MEFSDRGLALLCVLASLLGMAVLVVAAKHLEPEEKRISEIGRESEGKLVLVKGAVGRKKAYKGAYNLQVCWKNCIAVFVPARVAKRMKEASLDLSRLRSGAFISVEGKVEEYKGELEIVVEKSTAIEVRRP